MEVTSAIYLKSRNYFTGNKKVKFKLNESNVYYSDKFTDYGSLLYDQQVNPFIFRLKLNGPAKQPEKCTEYVGIVNEYNTCYMNSVIQALFHLPVIRKAVYKIPSCEESTIFAFQKAFYHLQTESTLLKLLFLYKALNWPKSYWNNQQDAQEILLGILDELTRAEGNYFEEAAVLLNLCEGVFNANIRCKDVEFESNIKEKFIFLQLDLDESSKLIECVDKYLKVETLTGENMYQMDNGEKHEAIRSLAFEKLPPILFVQFKRFRAENGEMIKVHNFIEYEEQLDLSSYYNKKDCEPIYSLYAVIVHEGYINKGHYFTFIKNFEKNRWIKFNDTKVTFAEKNEVFLNNFGGVESDVSVVNGEIGYITKDNARTAYILIYVLNEKIDDIFCKIQNDDVLLLLLIFIC